MIFRSLIPDLCLSRSLAPLLPVFLAPLLPCSLFFLLPCSLFFLLPCSLLLLHWLLVDHHPVDAELVAELAEAMREELFAHRHEDFAALGQYVVDALGLFV